MDDDPVVISTGGGNLSRKPSQNRMGWKTNPGVSRDMNTLVEVQLSKVIVRFEFNKQYDFYEPVSHHSIDHAQPSLTRDESQRPNNFCPFPRVPANLVT